MEAVPRMPMLAFELKISSEPVEFTPLLKYYISEMYHEDPEAYTKECNEFDQLRQAAVQVSKDFVGCSVLKKYYCQLHFLNSRFPLFEQRHDDSSSDLIFTWDDVYMGRPISHSQISYEQACILYNIGALHSILGALDNRQTPEGMKVSCTHFQCAAWAFEHLRDHFGSVLSADMSRDMLTFQAQLMLAQAQECILEKSMADNRKSTITAKVAEQIVEYYQMALKALDMGNAGNVLGSRQLKDWKRRLETMSNYHRSIKFLYLGNQSEEQQKWGERLAYLLEAHTRLTQCMKMAKNDDDDIEEAVRFTMDVIGGKYNAAKKDNDFIYHEKVPDLASLPDVKGASLVKGIPFNTDDPEVAGLDIFRKLVPIEAHEASSLYSEEKAKLLRRIGSAIEEKDLELTRFLTSLQMDVAHLRPETDVDVLPEVLMSKCAAISVRPDALTDLIKCMRALANEVTDVEGNIRENGDLLAEEDREETEFQGIFGKRARNVTLTEISKECDKYGEAMKKGSESNAELRKAMDTHVGNLKMLCLPPEQLAQALPSVMPASSSEDDLTVKEMERLFGKVDEMRSQRQRLGEQFRDQVHTDDITTTLVTREEVSQEEFFRQQLKKHDKLVTLIEQNMSAQKNILQALTETNAKYAPVKKQLADNMNKRQEMIRNLVLSYDVYEDLLGKCNKGVDFYKRIQANVSTLLERTQRVCRMQHEERQQIRDRYRAPARPVEKKPVALPSGLPVGVPVGVPVGQPAGQPKLKDYLPYMKPATFGQGAGTPSGGLSSVYTGVSPTLTNIPQLPSDVGSVSLPASQSPSPMHLPQLPASQPASPAHVANLPYKPQGYTPGGTVVSQAGVPPMLPNPTATAPRPSYGGTTAQVYHSPVPRSQPQQTAIGDRAANMPASAVPPTQQYQRAPGTTAPVVGGACGATLPQPGNQSDTSSPYPGVPQSVTPSQDCGTRVLSASSPAVPSHGSPYTVGAAPVCNQNNTQQYRHVAPLQTPNTGHFRQRLPSLPPGGASGAPTGYMSCQSGVVGGQPQSYLPGQPVQQVGTLPPLGQPLAPAGHPAYLSQQVGYTPHSTPGLQQPVQGVPSQATGIHTAGGSQTGQQTYYQGAPHPTAGTQAVYPPHSQGPIASVPSAYQPQSQSSHTSIPAAYHPNPNSASRQTAYQPQSASITPGVAPTAQSQSQTAMMATYRPPACNSNGSNSNYLPQSQYCTASIPTSYQSYLQTGNANIPASYHPQSQGNNACIPLSFQPQPQNSNGNIPASYHSQPQGSNANIQAPYRPQSHINNASIPPTFQPQLQSRNANIPASCQPQLHSSNANKPTSYQPQLQSNNANIPASFQPQLPSSNANITVSYQPQSSIANIPASYHPQLPSSNANIPASYQPQNSNATIPASYHPQLPSSDANIPASYQPQPQNSKANIPASYHPQLPSSNANIPASYQPQNSNAILPASYQPQPQNSNANIPASYHPQPQNSNANIPASYHPQLLSSNANIPASYHPPSQGINANIPASYHPQSQGINANIPASYHPQSQGINANPHANFQAPSQQQQLPTQQPQLPTQKQQIPPQQPVPQTHQQQQLPQQPPPLPAPLQPTQAPPERASSLPPTTPSTHSRKHSNASNASSLDDILLTCPEACSNGVLRPRVVTAEDVRRRREEEEKNQLRMEAQRDPYVDPAVLNRCVDQVSKFEKLVDGLAKHTLNGPTPLDKEWKELNDEQDQFSRKSSMAIARCYPLKNRYPHIMPYDASRVLLAGGKDDYINASHIGDLTSSCPKVIATQHPLPATVADFWQMVYEQGTEVIVMLCHDNELGKRLHPYWPEVKGQLVTFGPFSVSLQSVQTKQIWQERILSLTHNKNHHTRPVVHLQFNHWPPSGEPESPSLLLQLIAQVHYFYIQQRNLVKPLIVHCSNGVGRTGTFCVVYAGVQEVNRGRGIIDIAELVQRLKQRRKYMVEELSQLTFAYRAILYFAQDLLMKRGILTSRASFGDKLPARGERIHQRTPSEDFIMGTGNSLGMIQSNVAKMSVKASSVPDTAATTNNHACDAPTPESTSLNSDIAAPLDVDVATALNNKVDVEKTDSISESAGASPECDESFTTTIPDSLAMLQDPHTFQLGSSTPPSETRITKASFTSKTSGLRDNVNKTDDPLSALDPLWSQKEQGGAT